MMEELDPLLHQPLRTRLVAFLAGAGEQTFNDLKRQFEVTDGNLDAHLKKLLAAGYVTVHKVPGSRRPQSCFALTPAGLAALQAYVQVLQRLLPMQAAETPDNSPSLLPAWLRLSG